MVIKIPELHNFSSLMTKTVLKETGCESVPDWEISVQRRDDIAWSVVLSYLISTNHTNRDNFAERLKKLTGSNKNFKQVKKAIASFNPFKNRYSCFFNETLNQVVKEFKLHFNWNILTKVSDKLEAVSTALRCPIVSMWKDQNETKRRIYSKNVGSCCKKMSVGLQTNHPKNVEHFRDLIILYSYDFTSEENKNVEIVYNFMLKHELGYKMKKAALLYFLKEAKMTKKEIRRIESTVKKGNPFLISLLTKNCQDLIPRLYKSAYIVSKLNEAGYETDPRTRDAEGLSALYHALVLGDVKTTYVLYCFAANNCVQSEYSYRNPDCGIVNNLHQIQKILLDDIAKFEHHSNYDSLKKKFDDLLGLNKFLIEVNRKIIKIKNKFNDESTEETVFEACKRRDIIVSVLDTYQEFFKPIQQESTSLSPLDDYVTFKNYYNLIDMTTAIIFFDNIFLLKERLVLDDKTQFSEIESCLLFLVMYHTVFERVDSVNTFESHTLLIKSNINSFYIFPLIRRQENMIKIGDFIKKLQDTVINVDNVVRCIPESEIETILNSYPVYKDALDLERLKGYIKTAVNVKVNDVKSVMVIQRALQVIGEYITLEEKDFSFRRFLSLILPKEVSRILRRTRNKLSHLKSYEFKPKVECEKNVSLFRSIQKEIRLIQLHFSQMFQTLTLSGCIVVLKLFEKQLEQITEQSYLYASSSLNPLYFREGIKIVLNLIRHSIIHKYRSALKETLKTVLYCVENNILNEMTWSDDWESLKNDILYELWPLKWVVELLQECGEFIANSPLSEYETLKECNHDTIDNLKHKTNNFLAKCKDLLPLINTPRRRTIKPLKQINNIDQFLKILNGFIYLSNEERDKIRQEIPETVKESIIVKEKLIKSIKDGFILEKEELISKFQVSYLSNTKKNLFLKHYQNKDNQALDLLKTPDPITELEEIFSKNSVDKKKYDTLCDKMQFSEQSKRSLGRLVAGQRKKVHGNNLYNLLNRLRVLKLVLIEENGEVFNLWQKIKRPTSRIHVVDTILWYYLKDNQLQAAVEMLLFDCMSIYENGRKIAIPWIKSSKLYCGINLRNVISHGSPLLECLCTFLDPEDLPSGMITKILQLIDAEDSIEAILELFEQVDNDYPRLLSIVNSKEKDEYADIKNRILKCEAWSEYALLLPYKS